MKVIFKLKGQEYKPATLTAGQIAAGVLYRITGIKTAAARAAARSLRESWRDHAAGIQAELNEERRQGWGFCYLTGKRIEF